MSANKSASRRTLRSNLKKVDAHVVRPHEYKGLPELNDDVLSRAVVKSAGRPRSPNPRTLITLRVPACARRLEHRASAQLGSPRHALQRVAKQLSLDWQHGKMASLDESAYRRLHFRVQMRVE